GNKVLLGLLRYSRTESKNGLSIESSSPFKLKNIPTIAFATLSEFIFFIECVKSDLPFFKLVLL
ncbi:TPA: hypothetical protein ACG8C3_003018, partial [Enterococcus faecium]